MSIRLPNSDTGPTIFLNRRPAIYLHRARSHPKPPYFPPALSHSFSTGIPAPRKKNRTIGRRKISWRYHPSHGRCLSFLYIHNRSPRLLACLRHLSDDVRIATRHNTHGVEPNEQSNERAVAPVKSVIHLGLQSITEHKKPSRASIRHELALHEPSIRRKTPRPKRHHGQESLRQDPGQAGASPP